MWCAHCHGDVPQTAGTISGSRRCCRCGRLALASAQPDRPTNKPERAGSDEGLDLESGSPFGVIEPPGRWDEWTLAAEVQRARRLLSDQTSSAATVSLWPGEVISPLFTKEPAVAEVPRARPSRFDTSVPWWWLLSAVVMLAGGTLTVLRSVQSLAEWGEISQAFGLAGMALILLGVSGLAFASLVELNRLRRTSRAAVERLRVMEFRLRDYHQTALLAGVAGDVPHANIGRPIHHPIRRLA
jgi:hypothetical protein